MPTKAAQRPNFLLKITLVKTTNPTVTRLISVRFDLTFTELHLAIAAAFGWADACTRVALPHLLKYKGGIVIYCTAPGFGFEVKPTSLRTDSKVGQHFKKEGSGKFWTYDYNISRFHHAIEVVDTLNDDQKGTIGCLGGQGQVGRKAWQFADLGGLEGVTVGAKSTWDLDMKVLNQGLKIVQDAYEQRKGDEAIKAAAKKKAPPKDSVATLAPAKGKFKSKKTPQAKTPKKTEQPEPIPAAVRDNIPSTQTTPATSKAAKITPAGTTPPKSNTPAVPTPAERPPPMRITPAKSAPSHAAKANSTAKPTPPEIIPAKSANAAIFETLALMGTPKKRPLATGNQRKTEQAMKRAKVVKRESVVKDEDDEKKDIIRLGNESPQGFNVQMLLRKGA